MPQELGTIPEIVIGHITGGEVVLRDVTYEIDNPSININAPALPGPSTPTQTPADPIPIIPSKPEQATERMVLFDRVNLNYITAQPADGLDMINRNPQIEFVGSFDRPTAEKVADRLAANPPGNALELKAKQIPAALSELVVTQAMLQSAAELLSSREIVLRKLIDADRLFKTPTIDQMFAVAEKINEAARTLSPAQIDPNYGVTQADIAASESQTNPPMPIIDENIPAEEVVFSKPSTAPTATNFLPFGEPLQLTNLSYNQNPRCNFRVLNSDYFYQGAPSFTYQATDSLRNFITTPLTPPEYQGNGVYTLRDGDAVYFSNKYTGIDKFPLDGWEAGDYIVESNCPLDITLPIFEKDNPFRIVSPGMIRNLLTS